MVYRPKFKSYKKAPRFQCSVTWRKLKKRLSIQVLIMVLYMNSLKLNCYTGISLVIVSGLPNSERYVDIHDHIPTFPVYYWSKENVFNIYCFFLFFQVLYQNPGQDFNIHFPYQRGDLYVHSGPGGSLTAVLANLETIWTWAIRHRLEIPLRDLRVWLYFVHWLINDISGSELLDCFQHIRTHWGQMIFSYW